MAITVHGRQMPASFVTSVVFGALGVVLILAAIVVSSDLLFVLGVGAGTVSLIAALAWRSELIAAWRRRDR